MTGSPPAQLLLPLPDTALAAQVPDLPPRVQRIYCNRNLRMQQIQLIGFDMDYTLAIYNQRAMDRLSIEATASKLVARGYPRALLTMKYQPNFPIRGPLVDRKLGNILKTDRYRYVKRAFHGTRQLDKEARSRCYKGRPVRPGIKRYHSIDTLFALSEVTVFAAVVDALDLDGAKLDYARLFDDVRACIDEAHRDGSIKDRIVQDLPRFLIADPELPRMLHRLRSAGKRTFLLTNSDACYTEAVMRFLLGEGRADYPSWSSYFDIVVTSAAKPAFFTERNPLRQIGMPRKAEVSELVRGCIYEGGGIVEFERLAGMGGDRVLYVGDHIYGDVLRAKKGSAWRTLMIIQEMDDELEAVERCARDVSRMDSIETRRYALLDAMRERQGVSKALQRRLDAAPDERRAELDAARLRLRRSLERLRAQTRAHEQEYSDLAERVERAFHPFWGSVFKAGSELSSFGEQVESYACLYTARVTNLARYWPEHYFQGPRHRMAHE